MRKAGRFAWRRSPRAQCADKRATSSCDNAPIGEVSQDTRLKKSKLRAIATDVHFWIPFFVLVLGAALLLNLR